MRRFILRVQRRCCYSRTCHCLHDNGEWDSIFVQNSAAGDVAYGRVKTYYQPKQTKSGLCRLLVSCCLDR